MPLNAAFEGPVSPELPWWERARECIKAGGLRRLLRGHCSSMKAPHPCWRTLCTGLIFEVVLTSGAGRLWIGLADLFAGNHSARTLLGACEFWIACGSGSTALPAIARPSDKEQEQTFGEMSNGEAEAEARRCEQDQRPD